MTPRIRKLGDVLLNIYEFPLEAAIYLAPTECYDADTACVVGGGASDPTSFHQTCLDNGFTNWLNVAVVSDMYDEVKEKTAPLLIAAFNEDRRKGGWLWKMMNYRHSEPSV
jgi:hypothetical protein